MIGGGDDLDARRPRAIADLQAIELAQQRRVVGGVHARVRRRGEEVRDRRGGLPIEQERGEHHERARAPVAPRPAPAAGERACRHRSRDERAEPIHVAADGGLERVRADECERIQQRARAQHPSALAAGGGDQGGDQQHAGERGVEGGGDERLEPPFGECDGEQRDRHERGRGEPGSSRAGAERDRPGERRQREEATRHGTRERAQDGERERWRQTPALR